MKPRPSKRSGRLICDGLRSCASPHWRRPPFAEWSGYVRSRAFRLIRGVDEMCQQQAVAVEARSLRPLLWQSRHPQTFIEAIARLPERSEKIGNLGLQLHSAIRRNDSSQRETQERPDAASSPGFDHIPPMAAAIGEPFPLLLAPFFEDTVASTEELTNTRGRGVRARVRHSRRRASLLLAATVGGLSRQRLA